MSGSRKDLKAQLKVAAVAATMAVAGGVPTSAKVENEAPSDKMEYVQSHDKKYKLTDDDCIDVLASALSGGQRDKNATTVMMRKYIRAIDKFHSSEGEEYDMSASDLKKILKEIGCTEKEVKQGSEKFNSVVEDQKNGRTAPIEVFFNPSPHTSLDSPIYYINDGKLQIDYNVDQGELHINANTKDLKVAHLLPKLFRTQDGYECGSSTGDDKDFVLTCETALIKDLYVRNKVYGDMMKREAAGDKLSPVEKGFVKSFPEELQQEGLSIDSKGNLEQANPRLPSNVLMQQSSGR